MRKLGCAARKRGFACTVNYFKLTQISAGGPLPCSARAVSAPPCSANGVSPLPYPANRRYCIAQPYSADSGGAFAFVERTELSLASRKTVAFAGGVSPLPFSAKMRYYIAKPVARTAVCHSEPPRMRRVEEST